MYREQPDDGRPDIGWRFMSGNENDEYMNDSNNHHVFAINTICKILLSKDRRNLTLNLHHQN